MPLGFVDKEMVYFLPFFSSPQFFRSSLDVSDGTRGQINRSRVAGSWARKQAVVDVGDSGPIQKEIPRFIITHTVRIRGNGGTTVNPITSLG